jgi:ABC-type lipoprotein export system ATPase subunit
MRKHSLRLEHIRKEYALHDGTLISVLDDINVTFHTGTTVAVTGASGTGKSTLLHVLAGIIKPTSGAVFYDEQTCALWTADDWQHLYTRRIGLLFQQPYLIQELTVLENVMIKGMVTGGSYAQLKDHALHLLTIAGLADKAYQVPAQLSGGQQQRVALMRALFVQPDFLLADEPTGNLDPETGERMLEVLLDCQQRWAMGIIVSTHDSYVAQRMQTVYTLEHGQLREQQANF